MLTWFINTKKIARPRSTSTPSSLELLAASVSFGDASAMAHCATVVSLGRPYFSADRNITLTKFRQHNDHLVLRIGSWQFKPADSRPYFQTVRTSEEDRITDSEMFIADRVQARNEYEPVTLDLER